MSTPFAALQDRVNAAMVQHMANAAGTLADQAVTGIYTDQWQPADPLGQQIGGQQKTFGLPTSAVPADWFDAALVITAGVGLGAYTVAEHHEDGDGWSTLILREALA